MPYIQKEIKKLYYSIGEVATLFDVNASLIRFWEKEFEIIKPHKNKKGNRMFTQKDVDNFHLIFHLVKERGFTLQGAKDKIKSNKEDVSQTADVVNRLQKIKSFLLEVKNEL
ncbi:MAG: DNA-binding transcriptional MerR regulator [Parvicella sp.]|jgi:DNA-binding transcriptional MerR regulator